MAVNCAATSPLVLGNELFGYERDVFSQKRDANVRVTEGGKFQIARSGTVFIDEVGCLPLDLQPTILKALERRSVRRIGGVRDETTDVWIIAATSEDLRTAVRFGSFREDLYKHLTRLDLLIPPLRQRPDDILLLAEHFLVSVCAKTNVPLKLFAPDAQSALLAYHWPGNAREVKAVIERVASLYPLQSSVTAAMLALPI
jgi:transcriptional regulator with GAF, ATPase, and Fis domain